MLAHWTHLRIDMQRMFAEATPWHVPWMQEVSPQIEELASRHPERTIFARFITPARPEEMSGMWRDYYQKWEMMTRGRLDPVLLDLVPSLKELVPPARLFDKITYSPWVGGELHELLSGETSIQSS